MSSDSPANGRALYTYKAEADTELSVKKGETIHILDMCEGDWWVMGLITTLIEDLFKDFLACLLSSLLVVECGELKLQY